MSVPHLTSRPASTGAIGSNPAIDLEQNGRKAIRMRKYRCWWEGSDSTIMQAAQVAPALPIFDSAFSAFARGTLITTTKGPMAIEDLTPGVELPTSENGVLPVIWIGSMTLAPSENGARDEEARLTRIMSDSFGLNRPITDFIVGPGARVLSRPLINLPGAETEKLLIPATDLVDGLQAIEISPMHPVVLYHLCLRRHSTITANGLEMESFHPGKDFERNMGPNMLALFLTLFPHIKEPHQFGPLAHARVPLTRHERLERV